MQKRLYSFKTIRTYTGALMELLSNIKIQTEDSSGNVLTKNVPFVYSSKEKANMYQAISEDQLHSGNLNILPRGVISLISIQKSDERQLNRNYKTNIAKRDDSLEFAVNPVSYSFIYEFRITCRGMNDACALIEQIAPYFNPIVTISVYDTKNLTEPTNIPVRLLDLTFSEVEELSESSKNLFDVHGTLQLEGYLYPNVKSTYPVRGLLFNWHNNDKKYFIQGFDTEGYHEKRINPISVKGFSRETLTPDENVLEVRYECEYYDDAEFEWKIDGAAILSQDKNVVKIKPQRRFVDVLCLIKTPNENITLEKTFSVGKGS